MELTPREIEDRMEEAARTLRRLPDPPGSGPRGFGSSWPDHVQEARHAYGYHQARMRVVPSARDIQRMEEAIDWLRLIPDPDDRRIVWMRAQGHRWRAVGIRAGCVRSTAWRRWTAALLTISKSLKKKGKRRPKAAPEKCDTSFDGVEPATGRGETPL